MARVAKEVVEKRPEEIMKACMKLYRTMAFQEITLNEISKETSLSRPAIYNYFHTKEEIFLAILGNEYRLWNDSLVKIHREENLSIDGFAKAIGQSMQRRALMLRIQCMNLYEIEEHSRLERLVAFKRIYGEARQTLTGCIGKFFPSLPEETRQEAVLEMLAFMYGVYPYAYPTEKQEKAMREAGIDTMIPSISSLVESCIGDILRSKTMCMKEGI